MGDLIKKTALITALSLVAILLVGVFCITIFAPSFAGDCYFEIGLKSVAVSCYERAYNDSGSYEDLVELVDASNYSENDQTTATYGKIMLERKLEFADFCKSMDENLNDGYSTYDYYATMVMLAFYDLGDKYSAADVCFANLENGGYVDGCALAMAVKMAKGDRDFGAIIVAAYKSLSSRNFTNNTQIAFKNDMKELGYAIS